MENILNCPVCKNEVFDDFIACKDHVSSGETFNLSKCKNCDFVFTNPRPKFEECGKYYESSNYVSHQDEDKSLILYLYRLIRNRNLRWKHRLIRSYQPSFGNLLDYGCGLGSFLNFCKQKGWNTVGMDVSENARSTVKSRYNIDVFPNEELKAQKEQSFDVITLWHVLEHIYDLDETITQFKRVMKDDGTLFIAVPNRKSYDAKRYKEHWDAYDVPRHIYHFSPEDISCLMDRLGLKVVGNKGMFFDAFYVSMRSEMHRGKNFKIIRGFWKGLISNFKAMGNQNYSSVLYIIKKK